MSLFVLLQMIAVAIAIASFCVCMAKRHSPHTLFFNLLVLCVALYAVGYLLEITAPTMDAAMVARRVQLLGMPFLGALFFLFTRDYRGKPLRKWWQVLLVMLLPLIAFATANAWPATTLYYQQLLLLPGDGYTYVRSVPGLVYYLLVAYTFVLLLLGGIGLLRYLTNQNSSGRKKSVLLLLMAVVPLSAVALYVSELTTFNFTSAALAVMSVVLGVFIAWFQLMEWAPAAREQVLESISDGYILLDANLHYLDSNTAARAFFPTLNGLKPGAAITDVDYFPLALLTSSEQTVEFTLGEGESARNIRASRTLIGPADKPVGTSILMYDITEMHRLLTELNELATLDALTGLLNRGTFFKTASRDFELAMRTHQNAAVLMMDIDLFKHVNDKFGHLCGDSVLVTIAEILRGRLRRTDIIGRYGGEEICVWLPGASKEGAQIIAEVIRRTIEQTAFHCKNTPFQITISIGVSAIDHERHESIEDMIQDADTALYQAKETGRNRVCLAKGHEESAV